MFGSGTRNVGCGIPDSGTGTTWYIPGLGLCAKSGVDTRGYLFLHNFIWSNQHEKFVTWLSGNQIKIGWVLVKLWFQFDLVIKFWFEARIGQVQYKGVNSFVKSWIQRTCMCNKFCQCLLQTIDTQESGVPTITQADIWVKTTEHKTNKTRTAI